MNTRPHSFTEYLAKFGNLSPELIQSIDKKIKVSVFAKKTILLKAGKVCEYLYFIEKGMARNFSEEGDKIFTNDIVLEGEILVSFASFVSKKPSVESIELLEDSTLSCLHYEDLQDLYTDFPELERIGRKIAEYHYNSLAIKTHQLRFYSSTQRYQYLFDTKIEIIKRAPLGIIASYLGMTIENLSRIRNK